MLLAPLFGGVKNSFPRGEGGLEALAKAKAGNPPFVLWRFPAAFFNAMSTKEKAPEIQGPFLWFGSRLALFAGF